MRSGYRTILALCVSAAMSSLGLAQTYYVSPSGNDNNSGTSAASPWQTLAKVDQMSFAPGSQILFQDGGNWYGQQLRASSSGTADAPIIYGAYGSGANPKFWGSVPVPVAKLISVSGATNTYFCRSIRTVNAFFINHRFTHSVRLVSGLTSEKANLIYVENHPDTFYYDATEGVRGFYVNTGASLSASNVYSASIQDDVIVCFSRHNVTFKHIDVAESAKADAGYGVRIQNSTDVQVLDLTVTAAGKHAVGVLNSTRFVGKNISASYLMPDQGYGGASAFVTYADFNVSNTTSQWISDSFANANGAYDAIITHPTASKNKPTPIASVLIENMNTDADPAMTIYTTGKEQVLIKGGQITGGEIQLEGSSTTVEGVSMRGAQVAIGVGAGSGNIIQKNILTGAVPNWEAGHDGAIIDGGQGTIIRYNLIALSPQAGTSGACLGLESNTTGTQLYGNILFTPYAAIFQHDVGTPHIRAISNLILGNSSPRVIYFDKKSPDGPCTLLGQMTMPFRTILRDWIGAEAISVKRALIGLNWSSK